MNQYTKANIPLADRFWAKVEKTENCWLWKAARTSNGYGWFSKNNRATRAQRVAYELTYGEIPENKCVLHKCDNPPCVRPDHLFLGTRFDNNKDMAAKGRSPHRFGDKNPNSKLTTEQVAEIRFKYKNSRINQTELGKQYGVRQTTISYIISGKHFPV